MSESTFAPNVPKKDDGILAVVILISAIIVVVGVVVYLWRSKKLFPSTDNRSVCKILITGHNYFIGSARKLKFVTFLSLKLCSWKQNSFSPPPERAAYLAGKEKLDVTKVSDLDELKKLLMRRAIQTIPILLSLQNEGSSIERLYKRGMLTDDMHFKVKELKAFVDQEFQDVQFEADDLVEGWAQHIWPQAMQFHQVCE